MQTLDAEETVFIHEELEAGEKILWSGRSNAKVRMRKIAPFLIFFIPVNISICFCATFQNPDGLLVGGIAALFWVLLGLGIWFGQKAALKKQIYLITNKRAIMISRQFPKKTESYPPSKFTAIQIRKQKDGIGDVIFTQIVSRGGRTRGNRYPHGFLSVENPAQVKEYLVELQKEYFAKMKR